jgi:RimJ/RimL family protein N-acetyltransferase
MNLVNSVFYGADEAVGAFVRGRLRQGVLPEFDLPYGADRSRLFVGLGIVKADTLIGGVLFHNLHTYRGKPVCIECSIACDSPRWASRQTLKQLFGYPFVQLKCSTLIARIRKSNKRSRRLCEGLGFKIEGKIPRGFDGREDVIIYAMTSEQCRWIKERDVGKIITLAAART